MSELDQALLQLAMEKIASDEQPKHKFGEHFESPFSEQGKKRGWATLKGEARGAGRGLVIGGGLGVLAGTAAGAFLGRGKGSGELINAIKSGAGAGVGLGAPNGVLLGSYIGARSAHRKFNRSVMPEGTPEKYLEMAAGRGPKYAKKQMEIDDWKAKHAEEASEIMEQLAGFDLPEDLDLEAVAFEILAEEAEEHELGEKLAEISEALYNEHVPESEIESLAYEILVEEMEK